MALIGNQSLVFKSPGSFRSGATIAGARSGWSTNGSHRARFVGWGGWSSFAGVPDGNRPPYGWILPEVAGALASRNIVAGSGDFAGSAAGGKAAVATLTGSGDLTATGALIVSAVADLVGSGALSGDAVAYLNAAAALAGSGDLAGAATAIGHAAADLAGLGATSAVPYATGELNADLTPFTDLSPQSLADAVWATDQGRFLYAVSRNRVVTNPADGTYTVYDDDDTTVLYVADLWADAAGTTPYAGSGAERRDRLV